MKATILNHNTVAKILSICCALLHPSLSQGQLLVNTHIDKNIGVKDDTFTLSFVINAVGCTGAALPLTATVEEASLGLGTQTYILTPAITIIESPPSGNGTIKFVIRGTEYLKGINSPENPVIIPEYNDFTVVLRCPSGTILKKIRIHATYDQKVGLNNKSSPDSPQPIKDAKHKRLYESLVTVAQKELLSYDCKNGKAVQSAVLDSSLSLIYANVIVGGDDQVRAGTAASIAQQKDKGTVSVNYSKLFSDGFRALNFGLVARSGGSILNIFSPDSWTSEFGGSLGFTLITHGNGRYYNYQNCVEVAKARSLFANELLKKYQKTLSDDEYVLAAERDRVQQQFDDAIANGTFQPSLSTKAGDSTIASLTNKIKEHNRVYYKPNTQDARNTDDLLDLFRDDLAGWENDKNMFYGYHIFWADFKATFTNNTLNVSKDSVAAPFRKGLNTVNMLSGSIYAAINWSKMGKKTVEFVQLQLALERGSFINNPLVKKTPYASRDSASGTLYVRNADNAEVIGLYSNLDRESWAFVPTFYAASFFAGDMQFGWDIRAQFRAFISNIPGSSLTNSYTIVTGPVFRWVINKDAALTTIGIKAGLVDAPINYSNTAKDYFGARLEIGVPFKWYTPKKA